MRGLYPQQTVPFHLPIHTRQPEAARPTFSQRSLVLNERFTVDELIDEAYKLERQGQPKEAAKKLIDALAITLAGWQNIPETFDPAQLHTLLPGMLDYEDLWALYSEGMAALRLNREQLKKSASPSESDTAKSAATVPSADPTPETTPVTTAEKPTPAPNSPPPPNPS